jgi:aminoglycoside phosphotransferase family enzyme/predicted kinase
METATTQERLIESLHNPRLYDHTVVRLELIETHISWVILTGPYAYKVKKGVDFGFLDYSTLEKRRLQCEEELRLNRRTAPQLYLEVVPIGGSAEAPHLHQEPAIEYAVKMRQFPQAALLSQLVTHGELGAPQILALAEMLAAFHSTVSVAPPDSPFGTPQTVYHPVAENFTQVRERISDPVLRRRLDALEQASRDFFAQHQPYFVQRKAGGFIRDCHGDLHLNNILLLDGVPLLFDCLEFNPNLRMIDVISELAFLLMDLEEHGRGDLAGLLLNHYLELSGDYAGLRLLRFYKGYRAMVRAKVATLRLDQAGLDSAARDAVITDLSAYLALAEAYARPARPQLLITHGLSGSGKTTLTQQLLTVPGVVRIRSDVERKRLFGLPPQASSHSAPGENIYSAEASHRTYQQLQQLACAALEGGYSVIVDATFLQRAERDRFRQLAVQQQIPFTLLHFQASPETLQQRVRERAIEGSDASEADTTILQHQLAQYQPPGENEASDSLTLDSEEGNCLEGVRALLQGE